MNITLESAIQQFLIDQALKGNTKKTLKYYTHDLGYFMDYIGAKKEVCKITLDDLKSYLLMIKNRPAMKNHPFKPKAIKPVSSVTIQTYIRAVRSLLGRLQNEGYIKENLQAKFKLPKATKKAVEILSDDEIETIFKTFSPYTEMGVRNKWLKSIHILHLLSF